MLKGINWEMSLIGKHPSRIQLGWDWRGCMVNYCLLGCGKLSFLFGLKQVVSSRVTGFIDRARFQIHPRHDDGKLLPPVFISFFFFF